MHVSMIKSKERRISTCITIPKQATCFVGSSDADSHGWELPWLGVKNFLHPGPHCTAKALARGSMLPKHCQSTGPGVNVHPAPKAHRILQVPAMAVRNSCTLTYIMLPKHLPQNQCTSWPPGSSHTDPEDLERGPC